MTRRCGDCQLCCKLVPVAELQKSAGQRCKHQRVGKGCTVYGKAAMPGSCRLWNCRWLVNDPTGLLSRPDRSHYVIDLLPDFITVRNNETGETHDCPVMQVWIDPSFPEAHHDPALRRYLEQEEMMALVRFNSGDGIVLMPPAVSPTGEWIEHMAESSGKEHTYADITKAIGEMTAVIER